MERMCKGLCDDIGHLRYVNGWKIMGAEFNGVEFDVRPESAVHQ